jgi:Tfp pilus assembly protein FimT
MLKANKGYSISELAMVMVIIGILAFFLIPRRTGVEEVRGRAASQEACQAVRYAQGQAMAFRRPFGVSFKRGTNPNAWEVWSRDDFTLLQPGTDLTPGPLIKDPATQKPFRVELDNTPEYNGVVLDAVTNMSGNFVFFDQDGRPHDSNGPISGLAAVRFVEGDSSYSFNITPETGYMDCNIITSRNTGTSATGDPLKVR